MAEDRVEINLTDKVLVKLPVKDLHNILRSFSAEEKYKIRRTRMMLKNRGYAKTCAKKRARQKDLEVETQRLRNELEQLTSEIEAWPESLGAMLEYWYIERGQFRYIKTQPNTMDLRTRLWGITTEFVGFTPQSLVLRSVVLGWI